MSDIVLLSAWMQSQVEFWRKTKYDGYDVSNFGRLRSWRTTHFPATRRATPLILKPYGEKHGYIIIRLGRSVHNGFQGKFVGVHRLVAETFIPNPKPLPFVNHLTGLKGDNRADGLAWVTRSENCRHAWEHGLHKRDRFAVAKKMVEARRDYRDVPDSMIRMIRNMLKDGISQGQIRRWSGLKALTIQNIAVGRTYRNVA
jgi:hypothetical protein